MRRECGLIGLSLPVFSLPFSPGGVTKTFPCCLRVFSCRHHMERIYLRNTVSVILCRSFFCLYFVNLYVLKRVSFVG
ncbi:hypothetical protein D083_3416 [Dickeya solani RNS 08.23.3.1.A]|nr:hypothetical protein D083_3416 [Dickeya solani RNS 08.23.3.1.A]